MLDAEIEAEEDEDEEEEEDGDDDFDDVEDDGEEFEIDDDDEELKFVVNFLKRQSDRVGGELDAMINPQSVYSSMKNPFAGLTTAKGFGDVLVQTVRLPFLYAIDEEDKAYCK